MIIMEWDDRKGANILAKYPQDTDLSVKTLMQIYGTHEYNQEVGIISLTIGNTSITSYYSGPGENIYVILVLLLDEDPDLYEEGLTDAASIIIQNKENEKYKQNLPSLFHRMAVYPTFDDKRKLMLLYSDDIKRVLLNRLQNEGSILKSELNVWFNEAYSSSFLDLENLIERFVKIGLIKQATVKGITGDILFMINDILFYRIPPVEVLKDPSSKGLPSRLVKKFTSTCKEFFEAYLPNEDDNLLLMETLLDPAVYETVKLLRSAIVTMDDFEKLKKKGVDEIEIVLKILMERDLLLILQDKKGINYYCLKSDYEIEKYFPAFLLNRIRSDFNNNVKHKKVLLEHLQMLKDVYQEPKKAKA